MPLGIIIGLASGLASALLYYSAARGSPLFSALLLLLTPLPALLAGLGWGFAAAAAGAIAGALCTGLAASLGHAAGFLLCLGVPAVLVSYCAELSRPHPTTPDAREWYPVGRLLAVVALYAGALPVLITPLIGGSYEGLRAPLSELFRRASAQTASDFGLQPLSPEQLEMMTGIVVAAMPAILAAYWMGIFALNLYLAARIAHASGRLARDWPDLASLAYPNGLALATVAALAGSSAPGPLGLIGISFSGSLLFAYLLAGLALAHFIARGRAPWLLLLVYVGLFVFGPYAALVLTLGGLLDAMLDVRRRVGPAPPPST
jgi:hypothetical protein